MKTPIYSGRALFKIRTKPQNKLMLIVFLSMLFPTIIFGGGLYYLIDILLTSYNSGAELDLEILTIKIITTVIFLFVFFFVLNLTYSLTVTRQIAGPIERLSADLKDIMDGRKKGRLFIRQDDALKPFIDNVNVLLDKMK